MIAYLKGVFSYKSPTIVHVDVNGMGYEVQISLNTYTKIQQLDQGMLHTCLLIREDAHILYGFFDLPEKEMFLQLISVSGIGASIARVMLSSLKPEEIARAIIQGDTRTLESLKGIGKKTAERMIVELRDKLAKHPPESKFLSLKNNTLQQDSLNALAALGITRPAAEQAVQRVLLAEPEIKSIEELIKKALKSL
jgi:Holliday junction DNA helicase RuvA